MSNSEDRNDAEGLPTLDDVIAGMVLNMPAISHLECEDCGRREDVGDLADRLANGWPKCCGFTMLLVTEHSINLSDVDSLAHEIEHVDGSSDDGFIDAIEGDPSMGPGTVATADGKTSDEELVLFACAMADNADSAVEDYQAAAERILRRLRSAEHEPASLSEDEIDAMLSDFDSWDRVILRRRLEPLFLALAEKRESTTESAPKDVNRSTDTSERLERIIRSARAKVPMAPSLVEGCACALTAADAPSNLTMAVVVAEEGIFPSELRSSAEPAGVYPEEVHSPHAALLIRNPRFLRRRRG
jgi:hypothetical protein